MAQSSPKRFFLNLLGNDCVFAHNKSQILVQIAAKRENKNVHRLETLRTLLSCEMSFWMRRNFTSAGAWIPIVSASPYLPFAFFLETLPPGVCRPAHAQAA